MRKKFLTLLVGFALSSLWVIPPKPIEAYSTCSHSKESIITGFKGIYKNLQMSADNPTILDRYTDRQLGVFRISQSFRNTNPSFTIASVSPRSSIIVMKCSDISSQCSAALIVPNPWATSGSLMRTILPEDYDEKRPKFGGFDDDWVPIVVTNSSSGHIKFTLCDSEASFEFRQKTGQELISDDRCVEWSNVSDKWIVSCLGIHYAMTPVGEEIEAFIDYQRKQIGARVKHIVIWVLGAAVLAGVFYILVMKFVL